MFIDKLTRQDLDEFQFYIRNQSDRNGWNHDFQFEDPTQNLGIIFHEEIIKRGDLSNIEAVLSFLRPEDLTS